MTKRTVVVLDVSEKTPIAHSDDALNCMASVVLKLCPDSHYAAAVALGNAEATAMTMVCAVASGALVPDDAMQIMRETEKALGLTYPLATWEDVLDVCRGFAECLTMATHTIVMRMADDQRLAKEQTNLLN